MARPKKYTKKEIKKILIELDIYIENHYIPKVAEFAYLNDIRKATLYEIPELSYSIKRLIEKKEANLENMMLDPAYKGMAAGFIFSLKQLGWTDKTEVEHKGVINTEVTLKKLVNSLK